jgi:hypothetical protein
MKHRKAAQEIIKQQELNRPPALCFARRSMESRLRRARWAAEIQTRAEKIADRTCIFDEY